MNGQQLLAFFSTISNVYALEVFLMSLNVKKKKDFENEWFIIKFSVFWNLN